MAFTLTQKIALLAALASLFVNASPVDEPAVPITKQINEINVDGSFRNEYESGDGTSVEQVGYQKSNGEELIQVIEGHEKHTAPDGTEIDTTYTADEHGYQARGSHLPTSPPTDPIILKALAFLATLPSTPEPLQ